MMDNISYCQRCRRVFVRVSKNVCPRCVQEIEREYMLCHEYLREHPGATVQEIHEGTGVSLKQIEEFVKEGRFDYFHGHNLDYSCERCGRRIRKGRFCNQCNEELFQEFSQAAGDQYDQPGTPRHSGPVKGSVIWERRQQQMDD